MNWKNEFPKENRYFETEKGILYKDDFLSVISKIKDNTIDCIITDPPFGCNATLNGNYCDSEKVIKPKIEVWIKEYYRILKNNSYIFIYVPTLYIDNWVIPFKKYFKFLNIIALENMKTGKKYDDRFRYNLQLILVGSKGKPKGFNKWDWIKTSESWLKDKRNLNPKPYIYSYPSYIPNYWKATPERSVGHSDEKNWRTISNFIGISSKENDIILDGFAGSGSVLYSAETLNRRWIGIELNVDYCSLIKNRIKE